MKAVDRLCAFFGSGSRRDLGRVRDAAMASRVDCSGSRGMENLGLITCEEVLSAKVPNSSFAEARRVLLSEPTHMEDEDEGQEDEKENERDYGECKARVEERSEQPLRMQHG